MSTESDCHKTFLFQAIYFSQTVLIQPIQFNISIDFVYTHTNFRNSSILNNSVKNMYTF